MFDLRDSMPYIELDAYKITNYDFTRQKRVRRVKVNWFDNTREIKYEKGDFVFTPDILKQKIDDEYIQVID